MEEIGRVRLSVFTGTKARLNRVILKVLAQHGPLAISDLRKRIRTFRDFRYISYSVIYRRVYALEKEDYLEVLEVKEGANTSRPSPTFRLTSRGRLAVLLDETDFDRVLRTADRDKINAIFKVLSEEE